MTTVVYNHRDGELAAESRVSQEGTLYDDTCNKLVRLSFGWVGWMGDITDVSLLVFALEDNDADIDGSLIHCTGIVMPDKGVAYEATFDSMGRIHKYPLKKSWAIGSGNRYALGALHAGASAKQAVQAAIAYDLFSGGTIRVKKKGTLK